MCTVKLVFLLLSLSAPLLGPFSDCHSRSLLSGDQCEKNEQINKLNESIREYHFNFQFANYGSSFFHFLSLSVSFFVCLSSVAVRGMKLIRNSPKHPQTATASPVGANWCSLWHCLYQIRVRLLPHRLPTLPICTSSGSSWVSLCTDGIKSLVQATVIGR